MSAFYKPLLITLLSVNFFACYSQDTLIYPVFKKENAFSWQKIEKKVPKVIVTKFIKDNADDFEMYGSSDVSIEPIDSLYPHLHFLDLNNDGLNDVIFEGHNGGEAEEVEIYVATKKGYMIAFKDMQGIEKIDWENNKIKKLYIHDWGCCDDYDDFKKIYTVEFDDKGMPVFTQTFQGVTIDGAPQPDSLFEKQFRFQVLNDNYKIRSSPVIDDTSYQRWNTDSTADATGNGYGNIVAKLSENAQGTAIGWHTDNTGREWWYVNIDTKYKPLKNYLYDDGEYSKANKFPTKIIGWISSRFVKKL